MRPDWPTYFMGIADAVSKRSVCTRLQVGSVIVGLNKHIVGTGYNGPPSGEPDCWHGCDCDGKVGIYLEESNRHRVSCNSKQPCKTSIHSESNAIYHSTIDDLEFCEIFCLYSPCMNCAIELVWHGISVVTYRTAYRDTSSLEYLQDNGVKVVDFSKLK